MHRIAASFFAICFSTTAQADPIPDPLIQIIDQLKQQCANTGGCPVHFLMGEVVTTVLARSWRLTEMAGSTIVLIETHGSACHTSGAAACFEALTFDAERHGNSVAQN